jgi:CheY-like chemotaxis protein
MKFEQTIPPNKILVVDDEISLVQVCQLILEGVGHTVRGAVNGRQALRMVAEEMPDFILLDVMMPGMSGIEVCRQIRQSYPTASPIIAMYTADGRAEVQAASMDAGADAFITKQNPFFDLPEKINPYLVPATSAVG